MNRRLDNHVRRLDVDRGSQHVIDRLLDDFAGRDQLPREYALDVWGTTMLVTVWLPDGRIASAIVDVNNGVIGMDEKWEWSWRKG